MIAFAPEPSGQNPDDTHAVKLCSVCGKIEAKPSGHWLHPPPCFNLKPGLHFVASFCPKCQPQSTK